jgi:hypothetical protein
LAEPLGPGLTLPAPPAPPVAVAVWVELCEAELSVLNCAAALCGAKNPIAVIVVTTLTTSAVIAKDVLFICSRNFYNKNETLLIFVEEY